jgi:tetratricopeptide (TPR) repeat protein
MESRDAIDLYERALSLGGPELAWGGREARILAGVGEAAYWLGDFVRSRASLERALRAGPDDAWTRCVAHRFLGDIALNIDGALPAAEKQFALALEAARRLQADDRDFALARTLLVAGWAPYMRDDLAGARAMFEEALATARSNPEGDPWAEARALTFICSIISAVETEHGTLPLLEQALAVGRKIKDPFTTAVAQQRYATALAITGRLDEALPQAEAAAAAFADLGARWETASALGDVGEERRLLGRPREAEPPLREALAILRELGDRQQLGWVAAELARSLRMQGRGAEGRALLEETSTVVDLSAEPALLRARALLAYDAGDDEGVRADTERMIALQPRRIKPNAWARATWFASRLVGEEGSGGAGAVSAARERLQAAGWVVWLADPDLPLATIRP